MSLEHGGSRQRQRVRALLAERDGNVCHLCGGPINLTLPPDHDLGPTIDHVKPLALGGTDDPGNLKLAHKRCNQDRDVSPVARKPAPRPHPVKLEPLHPRHRQRLSRRRPR